MSDLPELKPCPFCGGEATGIWGRDYDGSGMYFIECGNGGCEVMPSIGNHIDSEAIKYWNTRDESIINQIKAEWFERGKAGYIEAIDTERERMESIMEKKLQEQHEIIQKLEDLIGHCWVHSGYANCGYSKMDTSMKELYDDVIKRRCEE